MIQSSSVLFVLGMFLACAHRSQPGQRQDGSQLKISVPSANDIPQEFRTQITHYLITVSVREPIGESCPAEKEAPKEIARWSAGIADPNTGPNRTPVFVDCDYVVEAYAGGVNVLSDVSQAIFSAREYVLSTNLKQSKNDVSLTLRLINKKDGYHLPSEMTYIEGQAFQWRTLFTRAIRRPNPGQGYFHNTWSGVLSKSQWAFELKKLLEEKVIESHEYEAASKIDQTRYKIAYSTNACLYPYSTQFYRSMVGKKEDIFAVLDTRLVFPVSLANMSESGLLDAMCVQAAAIPIKTKETVVPGFVNQVDRDWYKKAKQNHKLKILAQIDTRHKASPANFGEEGYFLLKSDSALTTFVNRYGLSVKENVAFEQGASVLGIVSISTKDAFVPLALDLDKNPIDCFDILPHNLGLRFGGIPTLRVSLFFIPPTHKPISVWGEDPVVLQ